MSNGAPPVPSSSPAPTEAVHPGEGGGGDNQRKDEKCRKTKIVREYDLTGKFWVDVEVLQNASFEGRQWNGPRQGNQPQTTIVQLTRNITNDGKCGHVVEIGMTPAKPGQGGGSIDTTYKAEAPHRNVSGFSSVNDVNRVFKLKESPECCKGMKKRIAFNHIKDEYMDAKKPEFKGPQQGGGGGGGGESGERPPFGEEGPSKVNPTLRGAGVPLRSWASAPSLSGGGPSSLSADAAGKPAGSTGQKYPPADPKDYKKVVRESKEGSDFYLDICIPTSSFFERARNYDRQKIEPKEIWKGDIDLPRANETPEKNGPFVQLDPFQAIVNFGPDALAVQFHEGDGGEGPQGGGGQGGQQPGGGGTAPPSGGSGAPTS